MAKTKHNHFLDTVDEIFTDAKNNGVFHLYSEDDFYNGRRIRIKGRDLYHFGTTGYLCLEQDDRLKDAAIEAIRKYGTQFALSKTYISFVIYKELEEALQAMYGYPVVIAKNSTLCHLSVIPSVVRDEDVVILDHQVHNSVQSACQMLKPRGIPVDMIRHSNLNMLEDKIKEYRDKHKKIWYMIDGIYSMYGDCAPLHELMQLLEKYPQLHLYVDDVHGMSWAGKNGTGYVLSEIKSLHEKMILVSTLSKCFGASGAIMVTANKEISRYVKNFGGALSFSAQLEPAGVAAALASARIHLSPDIYRMQQELADRINYCNALLKQTDLPLIAENNCPLFYIATGLPASGYNMSNRLMSEGYYVNLGIFPAVPVKNTGVRFTLSRGNELEDIKGLIQAMEYHYPKMLEDMDRTQNDVRKAFKLPLLEEDLGKDSKRSELKVELAKTITDVNASEWNKALGGRGIFDFEGMKLIENAFHGNEKPEDNWEFLYVTIKDQQQNIILSTYLTIGLWKDDMTAHPFVSRQIEEKRLKDPYFLTSKAVSMGSLLTDGDHLFLDKTHPEWKTAMKELLRVIAEEQEKANATTVVLRDFEEDEEVQEFLIEQGFIKVDIPDTNVVEDLSWETKEDYLNTLSPRSKRHIKYDVLKYEHYFDVEVKKNVSQEEIDHYYKLYQNVKNRNLDINIFDYPKKLVSEMSVHSQAEFLVLNLKPEYDTRAHRKPVAIGFNYLNCDHNYVFLLIGMDYDFLSEFNIYRQTIYRVIMRAKELKANKVYLGFSASIEKKKFGARVIPKVAYVQYKDNYAIEFIESLSVSKVSA
jgi:7-keto-8-aminopelargonate synthetase-like enzyme